MSSGKLFSVITVCLNAERTIGAALESVQRQRWPYRESIVVDGVSTDGTLQVVRTFGELVSSAVSEPDSGVYDAMNKGLSRASGNFIHFLNADDRFLDEDVLSAVAEAFDRNPGADLVYGDVVYVWPHGSFLRRFDHVSSRSLVFGDLCHQAVFARRSLFDRFGGFDPRWRINADYDWLLRVVGGGTRCHYLPRPIAFYDATGLSSRDQDALRNERLCVRRAHLASTTRYRLGEWEFRAMRKLRKLTGRKEFAPWPTV